MKTLKICSVLVSSLLLASCGGDKAANSGESSASTDETPSTDANIEVTDENTTTETVEPVAEETADVPAQTPISETDFVIVPKTVSIAGPLKDYVVVEDKAYTLEEGEWDNQVFYTLNLDFDVIKEHSFGDNLVRVYFELYDADGNLLHFTKMMRGNDESTAYSEDVWILEDSTPICEALAKGSGQKAEYPYNIHSWFIKGFTPDMFKKAKTFKVYSKLLNSMGMEID